MKKLSEENMKKLIDAVAKDITDAKLYFKYIKDLERCLLNEYPNVLGSSHTFWCNTKQVYHLAMQMCLMRAYDQNDDAVGLRLLLNRIKNNLELFTDDSFKKRMINNPYLSDLMKKRICEEEFKKKLSKDINSVNNKKKQIKDLVIIRNNNGFHKSEEVLYGEKPNLDKIKLNFEEIEKLIDESLEILNFYSNYFDANLKSGYMIGYGDHEELFKIIQNYYMNLNIT